jgi:hypothetical protein
MSDQTDQFDWRPMSGQWRSHAVTATAIVLACGAFGVLLAQCYPLGPLISAIERNGVPAVASSAPQGDWGNPVGKGLTPIRAASQQAHEVNATSSPTADPTSQPIRPRILNPGTTDEPALRIDQSQGSGRENLLQRPEPQAPSLIERQPIARVHAGRGRRNRNVLVVVRRVVPPYDIKVLRGRMQDGHLIVDGRDRRGMTIR